jgi:hypothetical protein
VKRYFVPARAEATGCTPKVALDYDKLCAQLIEHDFITGTAWNEVREQDVGFWVVTRGYEIDIAEVHYPGDVGISLHNWTTGFGQLGRLQEGVEG